MRWLFFWLRGSSAARLAALLVSAALALSPAQAQFWGGGGGGSSSLTMGATPISGGTVGNFLTIGTGGFLQNAGSSATIAFPQAATGATSGGVVCATSTTNLTMSAAITPNGLIVGGGPGVCPSSITTAAGMVTALGVGFGVANGFVAFGGALGTPSSGNGSNITNVNAASLGGATFAAPGAIGSTTPSTEAFTTLSASSTISGTGFSTYLASPPAIGGTAPAGGSFTTLSASSTVTGAGFSTYLASPPAIGGTTPAAGSFSSLQDTGITGSTQCIHADTSGNLTGTGSDCGAGGSGFVNATVALSAASLIGSF